MMHIQLLFLLTVNIVTITFNARSYNIEPLPSKDVLNETGEPLANAGVSIERMDRSIKSNREGVGNKKDNAKNVYKIKNKYYAKKNIEIHYPQISGLMDTERQKTLNELLKKEAFREHEGIDDISLSIEYEVLFQGNHYLCVVFSGFAYVKNAPYPRDLFYTVNIDLNHGCKRSLAELINVDDAFVNKVRGRLTSYMENGADNTVKSGNTLQYCSDYAIVYKYELDDDNGDMLFNLFKEADSEYGNDCFSYFTKEVFGIIISTNHNAGDHYEVELKYEDIKEHLHAKDLLE